MKLRPILIVAAALSVGACAGGARIEAMHDQGSVLSTALTSPYRQSMTVGKVSGGQETNPLWVSKVGNEEFGTALRESLQANALLASKPSDARYVLDATLVALEQPIAGFDMTVKAAVKYTLKNRQTGQTAYDKVIARPYTAKFGDSLYGVERLRKANEGAIRTNIKIFLEDLVGAKTQPGVPGS